MDYFTSHISLSPHFLGYFCKLMTIFASLLFKFSIFSILNRPSTLVCTIPIQTVRVKGRRVIFSFPALAFSLNIFIPKPSISVGLFLIHPSPLNNKFMLV